MTHHRHADSRHEDPRDNCSAALNSYYGNLTSQGVDLAYGPTRRAASADAAGFVDRSLAHPAERVVAQPLPPQAVAAPIDLSRQGDQGFHPVYARNSNCADDLMAQWQNHVQSQQRRETARLQQEWGRASITQSGEPMPGHGPPARHTPIYINAREGSIEAGFDFGVVEGGASIGRHTGVYVGSPILATRASLNADVTPGQVRVGGEWQVAGGLVTEGQAGVYANATPTDLRLHAGGDAHALGGLANGTFDTGVRLGERTGVYTRATSNVGPFRSGYASHAYLTPDGVDARARVDGQIDGIAGGGVNGQFSLGRENALNVNSHAHVLGVSNRSGVGIYSDRGADIYSKGHVGYTRAGFDLNPPVDRHRKYPAHPDLTLGGLY